MEVTPANVALAAVPESILAFYLLPSLAAGTTLISVFFASLLLNFALYGAYKLVVYPFFLSPLRHLPTARGFRPLVGHGLALFARPPGQPHLDIINATPNDGVIRTYGFFHTDRLIVTSPAAIADVLVHKSYDFEKPAWISDFLRRFLGNGLVMLEGDVHRHHRKQIMPAFSFRQIKELYPVFWSKAIEFCDTVEAALTHEASKVLEIGHYSTQVTLDIIGLAGLGRDIASLRSGEDELAKTFEEVLEPTSEKAIYFLCHLLFPPRLIAMLPWKLNERVKIMTGNLKRICTNFVIDQKAKTKLNSDEKSRDILSFMIRSNNFSDQSLVDHLLTFIAAGHETTSSALTWASYLLSTHPAVQTRLRAEIHAHIPSPTALSSPTADIAALLESMPYLNAVCNETLRLYPTIPVSSRCATRPTTIAGVCVPKGTLVFLVPWAINRSPALWGTDAEVFEPGRWIDGGRATLGGGAESNYAFLTFLHGPRSCIGERFARAELRALVAAFVGRFEMQMAVPGEQVVVGGTITSKPVNGMRLRLERVEWGE
ncbi:cytochrome P450 [Boeremia exigua]|uniref:cytochrome P450 n=1 Tax=Boeremia exigua TaxID=749465 RepID=UPI001E8E8A42|nr:cytochrome P450 [Boeremia exigua]KAH6618843.1 cytochrome P450 [Boeremia exigua]